MKALMEDEAPDLVWRSQITFRDLWEFPLSQKTFSCLIDSVCLKTCSFQKIPNQHSWNKLDIIYYILWINNYMKQWEWFLKEFHTLDTPNTNVHTCQWKRACPVGWGPVSHLLHAAIALARMGYGVHMTMDNGLDFFGGEVTQSISKCYIIWYLYIYRYHLYIIYRFDYINVLCIVYNVCYFLLPPVSACFTPRMATSQRTTCSKDNIPLLLIEEIPHQVSSPHSFQIFTGFKHILKGWSYFFYLQISTVSLAFPMETNKNIQHPAHHWAPNTQRSNFHSMESNASQGVHGIPGRSQGFNTLYRLCLVCCLENQSKVM